MKVLRGLFGALGLVVFVTSTEAVEKRVALVIGNSAYQHAPALANPSNDASDMAAALERLQFKVVRGIDLDRAGMERALREYGRALTGAGLALFFYAGHGLQVEGHNYLVPVDAGLSDETDLAFQTVDVDVVMRLMERTARTSLVFLDSCRDNPLARTLARSMGATRSQVIGTGLAPLTAGEGTLIVYATQPGNVALDGIGRNSPFTSALLQHIEAPVDVQILLRSVRETVKKATDGKQQPWDHSSLTGGVVLAPGGVTETVLVPTPSVTPPAQVGPLAVELTFWESIKGSGNVADFVAYLDKYPDGEFALLARNRLEDLEKVTPPAPATQTTARLVVRSNVSGDTVYVDGNPYGSTSARPIELAPGTHTVRVEKGGYATLEEQVTLTAGETQTLRFELPAQVAAVGVVPSVRPPRPLAFTPSGTV